MQTVTDAVTNFACGGLFSFLYFNFVHDSIHYLCANCDKFCKKNCLRWAFSRPTPIFQFRQLLDSPQKCIPAYATARDYPMHTRTPRGGLKIIMTPPGGRKQICVSRRV